MAEMKTKKVDRVVNNGTVQTIASTTGCASEMDWFGNQENATITIGRGSFSRSRRPIFSRFSRRSRRKTKSLDNFGNQRSFSLLPETTYASIGCCHFLSFQPAEPEPKPHTQCVSVFAPVAINEL